MLHNALTWLRNKLPVPLGARTHASIVPPPHVPALPASRHFWNAVAADRPQRVLEVGTLRSVPDRSTVHRRFFGAPGPAEYTCLDVQAGADVDVVGDLHALPAEWTNRFDAFVAVAVFEHLERPWVAAREVARALAPGGRFFVSTHQCFPIHAYPSDFFRFSREALRLIFEDAGLVVEVSEYQHRCAIVMPEALIHPDQVRGWNETFPSYVLVEVSGHKPR